MQVQSAISLLYVRWNPDSPRVVWDMMPIRVGLARMPVISQSGSPNTPLAFRRRDACHSKQQAGHGKIAVEFGHGTKDSISRIADYDTCISLIVPQKNRSGLYVVFGAKTHQRYPIAT